MRRWSRLLVLLAVAGSTALFGCAPPSENSGGTEQTTSGAAEQNAQTAAADPGSATESGQATGPVTSGESVPSEESGTAPDQVVFESFAGGVAVPRCPQCGDIFREGVTTCEACGHEVVPWNHAAACPHCDASGVCRRCGDDRPCLACSGDGVCVACQGHKTREDRACLACAGKGRCLRCGGDGVRSVRDGDFLATETALPGICPTCVDGTGRCPDCGGTAATGGVACATCDGDGACSDCRGSGTCASDRGDGLCVVCGGSGREVVNGPRPAPGERTWSIVRVDEAPVRGRVVARPAPDLHVQTDDGGKSVLLVLVADQVDALSYYLACRDHTSLDDTKGRELLAEHAERLDFLPLALVELRRAASDRARARALVGLRDNVTSQLADTWLAGANEALASGDRHTALVLGRLSVATATSETRAASGRAFVRSLTERAVEEEAELSPADRARREEALRARLVRTAARAQLLLRRADERLRAAEDAALSSAAARTAFDAADWSAWAAERVVGRAATDVGTQETEWPEAPAALMAEARAVRARIALSRAATEIRAGRFVYGARLARRAADFAPGDEQAQALLREAQRGMARTGVLRTPPEDDPE